jgi:hypothetical protein
MTGVNKTIMIEKIRINFVIASLLCKSVGSRQ